MNIKIGKILRELRKQKSLSQEQVAEYLCISQSSYARIERGKSHSWTNHIHQICKAFEITPEELLTNFFLPDKTQESDKIITNQLSEKLIEQYETRLKEKDEIIAFLKNNNSK